MNSCLYECTLIQNRHTPAGYRFKHKFFIFYLDLEEVSLLGKKSWFLGHNQNRIYNFCESDHIPGFRQYLVEKGIAQNVHHIKLLTNLRTFGHAFNSASFYFCFDEKNEPVCSVVEMANTYREMKFYYLGPEKYKNKVFSDRQIKHFYSSPFTELDDLFGFRLAIPNERLDIKINVLKNDVHILSTVLTGKRQEISTPNLLWVTFKFPFVTLITLFLIYWHSYILYFVKNIQHRLKKENPELQKEVYHQETK